MSTNDRGMKKWVTMMLPEHKEILKDMWTKKDIRERPLIDEHVLEQFSHRLSVAYDQKILVQVTYYTNKAYDKSSVCTRTGVIMDINPILKKIHIDHVWINMDLITNIEFVNELNE